MKRGGGGWNSKLFAMTYYRSEPRTTTITRNKSTSHTTRLHRCSAQKSYYTNSLVVNMPPNRRRASDSAPTPEPKRRVTRSSTKAETATTRSTTLKPSEADYETPNKKRVQKSKKLSSKNNTKQEKEAPDEQTGANTALTPLNVTNLTITHPDVKKPIQCHQYTPKTTPSDISPTLIFTHGAGGTLSAEAVVNFRTGFSTSLPVLAFQGSMNLKARTKSFHVCIEELRSKYEESMKSLVLGGRSMGARAAAIAASEFLEESDDEGKDLSVRLVLISYPLQGPKDVRDQILLDLPGDVSVLFIIGDKDAMCPLDLLNETREKMSAKSQLVLVKGADHGMHVKPAKLEQRIGEETGRLAATWVDGGLEEDVVYIGGQEYQSS
jgi:predicted alpha/beta-hydrolase family hydrolase